MPLRPACPGTEIARAPHSRRARDLRGVGSPEGSGLLGRRPAARKEAGAAPAVSRCMGQQGAVARGGGLGRPPSRSARQAERARGPGGSRQAEEDICTYCVAGGTPLCIRHTPPYRYKYRGRYLGRCEQGSHLNLSQASAQRHRRYFLLNNKAVKCLCTCIFSAL